MNKDVFRTDHVKEYWRDYRRALESYYSELTSFKFESCEQAAEKLEAIINNFEKSNANGQPDKFFNDCFIFKTFALLLRSYAKYWSQVCDSLYPESWDTLQDVLDSLRLIKRFSCFDKSAIFKFIEKQTQSLELLYPYKVFASVEIVVGRIDCSICGNNMHSSECSHIKGELYRGKLAYGIVKEIKKSLSVSLVENPADKRCKVSSIDGKPANFDVIKFLKESVSSKKVGPLQISHADERIRRIKLDDISDADKNELCPCGSGKKLKDCCIYKEFVEKKHIDIVILNSRRLTLNDFLRLSGNSSGI